MVHLKLYQEKLCILRPQMLHNGLVLFWVLVHKALQICLYLTKWIVGFQKENANEKHQKCMLFRAIKLSLLDHLRLLKVVLYEHNNNKQFNRRAFLWYLSNFFLYMQHLNRCLVQNRLAVVSFMCFLYLTHLSRLEHSLTFQGWFHAQSFAEKLFLVVIFMAFSIVYLKQTCQQD